MNTFFQEGRVHNGLTHEAFQTAWEEKLKHSLKGLDRIQRKYYYYAKYNLERATSVHKAYSVSDALRDAVTSIDAPQYWMVLTEDWCSDSAFTLPILIEAAALNDYIILRILRRDDNLDIMDQYLTQGARSIPKLVAFTEQGDELFQWGPRPAEAQQLRTDLKAEGREGGEISKKLIAWYEAGGWLQVDHEIADLLREKVDVV